MNSSRESLDSCGKCEGGGRPDVRLEDKVARKAPPSTWYRTCICPSRQCPNQCCMGTRLKAPYRSKRMKVKGTSHIFFFF